MFAELKVHEMLSYHPCHFRIPRLLCLLWLVAELGSVVAFGQSPLPVRSRVVCDAVRHQEDGIFAPLISLSFDGSQLVVLRSKGRVSLFDQVSLAETPVEVDPRCIGVVTDPQNGGVLVILEGQDSKVPKGHSSRLSDLEYYDDLDSFCNQRIGWKMNGVAAEFLDIFSIHGTQLTAVIEAPSTRPQLQSKVRIIEPSGRVLCNFDFRGKVLGIEPTEDLNKLAVYFGTANDSQSTISIKQGLLDLDAKRMSIAKIQQLYEVAINDRTRPARIKLFRTHPFGSRSLRVRGSQPDDVRYLITELLNRPDFFEPDFFPMAPSRYFNHHRSRLSNLNIVASDQDPAEFEFMLQLGSFSLPYLFNEPMLAIRNRDGLEAYLDPKAGGSNSFVITDGVKMPDGIVVTLSAQIVERDQTLSTYELSVLDIGQRAEKR